MTQPVPPDPMTALGEGAAMHHEVFMAWVRAGFTRTEALQLLVEVIRAGLNHHQESPDE